MRCEQARQLFDAYLNGELSPSLTTELGAHRVRCPECRRALALMEVAGHIVASDRDSVALERDFTDRLIACVEQPRMTWTGRFRRRFYVMAPLAAAALVALAFLGVFDRPSSRVAGDKTVVQPSNVVLHDDKEESTPSLQQGDSLGSHSGYRNERELQEWIEQTKRNMAAKRQSGESLQEAFDLTVRQLLDILKEADEASDSQDGLPGDGVALPLTPPETGNANVEDL